MKIVEVTAHGFDAGTDATDDRVLWVFAQSVDAVKTALDLWRAPHLNVSETDLDPNKVTRPEVLDLDHDDAEIVARLYGFAMLEVRAVLRRLLDSTCKPPGEAGALYDEARRIAATGNDTFSN